MSEQARTSPTHWRRSAALTTVCVLAALFSVVYVAVAIVIPDEQEKSFVISGELGVPLLPGRPLPFDLRLTNQHGFDLSITKLTVSVTGVATLDGAKPGQCVASEFKLTQYSGPYPFTLPASESVTLSKRGLPQEQWPQVELLDELVNQDACEDATLTFRFGGTARIAQ